MNEEKICGTCIWHKPAREAGRLVGWTCTNEDAYPYGIDTDYDDKCEDWSDDE